MSAHDRTERNAGYIFILIFALMAIGIFLIGYLYYLNYERNFRAEKENELSSIAELKVGELVQWRKERMGDGAILFKNKTFSALARRFLEKPGDIDAQGQLQAWLGKYTSSYPYTQVYLVDARGIIRMSVPEVSASYISSVSESVTNILRSGQVGIEDFYRNTPDGPIHLAVLVPIFDDLDDRRPLGVLSLQIDPAIYLYPFISKWPTPSQTAETLIVRRDGGDALFLSNLRFHENAALNLRIPLTKTEVPAVRAALGQTGVFEGVDYRGAPVIAAVKAVPGSPWYLLARMNISEVYAPVKERLWETVTFAFILFIGSSTAIGFVWRQKSARYRERHGMAEAISESEKKYRGLFQGMVSGFSLNEVIFNERGEPVDYITLEVNREFERLLGVPKESVVGKRAYETVPGLDRKWLDIFGKVALTGMPYTYVEYASNVDKWFEGTVFCPQKGFAAGTFIDITGRKRAEEALHKSAVEVEDLYNLAPCGYHSLDGNGVFVRINDTELLRLGYAREEIIGKKKAPDLMTEESREIFRRNFPKFLATGEMHDLDIEWVRKDGSVFNSILNGTAIRNEKGEIVQTRSTIFDVTGRKKAEEALQSINWLLKEESGGDDALSKGKEYEPDYGDLTALNTGGEILNSVDKDTLYNIVNTYLDLLGTSSAIYEKNGGYAIGLFSSSWCRFMDSASRKQCATDDNRSALAQGKWLCHESCWSDASKVSIRDAKPVDIECHGGIRLYAVPIYAGTEAIGSINFGYGNPPIDPEELKKIAERYSIDIEEIARLAKEYKPRPPFLVELAKRRLRDSANLIGVLVERKRAEKAVKESEARYRQLSEASFEGIVITVDGKFVDANGAFARMFGYTPNEIIGMAPLDLASSESSAIVMEHLNKGIEGPPYGANGVKKDGSTFPVELQGRNILYQGQKARITAIRDISQRVKAEQAIRESEEKYRELVEGTSDWVWELNENGAFTYSSPQAFGVTGYRPEELLGKTPFDFMRTEEALRVAEFFRATVATQKPFKSYENSTLHKDGHDVVIEMSGVPFYGLEGKFMGHRGINRDITERKRVELLLRESETRFRGIFESTNAGVALVDIGGHVTSYNKAFRVMLGLDAETMLRSKLADFTHPDDLKLELACLSEIIAGKRNEYRMMKRYISGPGIQWVDLSVNAIRNERGELINFVGVAIDITARKAVEDALRAAKEEAEKATLLKDKYVSLVSHDLKNPLGTMMGFLKMIHQDMEGKGDHRTMRLTDAALESAGQMQRLINEVLSISRIKSGVIQPNLKFFDGFMLGVKAGALLGPEAAKKGITLVNAIPRGTRLYADEPLFGEVVNNLVSNAIKFSKSGDTITMFVPDSEPATIAVKDAGVGIRSDLIPKLFKYEEKTSTPGTAGERGSGLGLPLSRDIMVSLGGSLDVESEQGTGSTFYARLPRVRPKILIVDDDRNDRMLLGGYLSGLGVTVLEADDGRDALRVIGESAPHLLVVDIVMPNMDGFELLEEVRKNPATSSTPFIMVAIQKNMEVNEKSLRLGANDFINKPISMEEFIPRVRRFIG